MAPTYEVSSKTGMRHVIDGTMPDNMTALAMLKGQKLPIARCGREIQVVNFYKPGARVLPRYMCSQCA